MKLQLYLVDYIAKMAFLAVLTASVATAPTWNFLAIGDWGNDSPGQYAAAAGMGTVAAEINATRV